MKISTRIISCRLFSFIDHTAAFLNEFVKKYKDRVAATYISTQKTFQKRRESFASPPIRLFAYQSLFKVVREEGSEHKKAIALLASLALLSEAKILSIMIFLTLVIDLKLLFVSLDAIAFAVA